MAKVEVDIIKKIHERHELPVRVRNEILQDIKHVLEQEAREKEMKPPRAKKEFQLLMIDPAGLLKGNEHRLSGLILQAPEGTDPAKFLAALTAAAYEHNASPIGRKFPVDNIAEAVESVSPKIFREHGLSVKTKIPVRLTITNGKLPPAPGLAD